MRIAQGTLIWRDPIIVYSAQIGSVSSLMETIGDELRDREMIFLPLIAWSVENEHGANSIAEKSRAYVAGHPKHRIIHMCNTEAEVAMLRARGEKAEWFNHNIFVDPKLYAVSTGTEKSFTAIYNATLQPWKRHRLASLIDSVAFVYHSYNPAQEEYRQALIKEMPNACFVNHANDRNGGAVSKAEVVKLLSASRAGLCLSAIEGAMHSSVEYLLCGLPVVSTENYGGRNEFLLQPYARIVSDDPYEISIACRDLIALNIDPMHIRSETISRQQKCLNRFKLFLNRLLADHGVNVDVESIWGSIYQDKLLGWEPSGQFLARI